MSEPTDIISTLARNAEEHSYLNGLAQSLLLAKRLEQKAFQNYKTAKDRLMLQEERRKQVEKNVMSELKGFCKAKGIPFDESEFT